MGPDTGNTTPARAPRSRRRNADVLRASVARSVRILSSFRPPDRIDDERERIRKELLKGARSPSSGQMGYLMRPLRPPSISIDGVEHRNVGMGIAHQLHPVSTSSFVRTFSI